jgi:hypothetical protein
MPYTSSKSILTVIHPFNMIKIILLFPGARGQYVDVLGGGSAKSATAPSGLFNVLPKSASMPAKLFVPGSKSFSG